jgi:N-acetylneuraminic acid mutarotase
VVADGWLYVYGGHIGTEHDHSAANLSQHFRRIRVDGGTAWEELPMQTPLQGVQLVAHSGKVYRVGGLDARNATIDEEEDLHSTADFTEYDPVTREWKSLPALPAARSSHNAAVIGDRLYVVGGWTLSGSPPGDWTHNLVVYDFADPQAGWQEIETPPFKRRALAAGHCNGKLFVLGGIDAEGDVTLRVDVLDPQSLTWSKGPDLPGEGIAGFGVSAWNLDGRLYASGMQGIVWRLNEDGSAWEAAAQLNRKRFFHQLVPASNGGLLAVGGASHEGHIADIEWIDVRD